MLSETITLDLIQVGIEVANFEEGIRFSVEPLRQAGYVDQSYIDNIINIYKETGPYIVIAPHIALPHAPSDSGAKKVGIGFMKLSTPVESGNKANDPVRYFFPLSAPDSTSHIELLSTLAQLLGNEDFILGLEEVETKVDFVNLLKQFEGGTSYA